MQVNYKKGIHLLEFILAVGLFSVILHSYARMVYLSNNALQEGVMEQQALLQSAQALEIARTIRDRDFGDISAGTHGFRVVGNEWELFGSSYQSGVFDTQLIITEPSVGRYDVEAVTSWDMVSGVRQTSLETVLTEWNAEKTAPPPPSGP